MKTTETNDRLTRWLDEAMNPGERAAFEKELAENPSLRAEAEALRRLGGLLRENVTMEMPLPNADFFNVQIQQHITEQQQADERRTSRRSGGASWLGWLRSPWIMAGAAAVLTLGFFLLHPHQDADTQVLSLYAPDPAVHATTRHDAGADATVLTLDGLSAFPDDQTISLQQDRGPARLKMAEADGLNGAVIVAAN